MTAPNPSTSDTTPMVLTQVSEGIGTITLNRPDFLNILTRDMVGALHDALRAMYNHEEVRVIILAAQGKAFCAGHDLKEINGKPEAEIASLFGASSEMTDSIRQSSKPVIAQVQGVAVAAGCQLVASCDLVMAADGAKFGTTGIKAGLFCSVPMVPLSRVVQPRKALEMLFTGDVIDAEEAERIGLVNHVVPAEDLAARTMDLATRIAANSGYSIALGKQAFFRQLGLSTPEAYQVGREAMAANAVAEDCIEGMTAFIEKRPAKYKHR